MTTYTLHKISEGFIITSDEKIEHIGLVMHFNGFIKELLTITDIDDFCGIKEDGGVGTIRLANCQKVIVQQDQIDFSNLNEEECKLIGWFDVEKLSLIQAKDQIELIYGDRIKESKIDEEVKFGYLSIMSSGRSLYEKGFQKALELLSEIKQSSWNIEVELTKDKVKILKVIR
jgi:hypothetical protein